MKKFYYKNFFKAFFNLIINLVILINYEKLNLKRFVKWY